MAGATGAAHTDRAGSEVRSRSGRDRPGLLQTSAFGSVGKAAVSNTGDRAVASLAVSLQEGDFG